MVRYRERVPTPRWLILIGWMAAVAFASGGVGYLIAGNSALAERIPLGLFFLAMAILWVGIARVFDHLRIEVREDSVRFGYGPLGKTIDGADLVDVEVERYPWLVYGGWGIRFSTRKRRAYSVPGCRQGAALLLRNGTRYHVSSRSPESLTSALQPLASDRPGYRNANKVP